MTAPPDADAKPVGPGTALGVDVVIVNWNAGSQLRACLEALTRADTPASLVRSVIVVDNASTDGSAEHLADVALPLTIVRNETNRGFAAACNQGAARGHAEFILFLNPDVRVEPPTLITAVAALRDTPHAGAVGIQLIGDDGRVARSCARFPSALTMVARATGLDRLWPSRLSYVLIDWDHQQTRSVDHVIGAFYLVRRSVFAGLGGFDERFFLYLEDVDFSYRMARAGWSCVYLSGACAYHRGGGTSHHIPARRLAYALRSRLAYAGKHFSSGGSLAVWFTTLTVEPVVRLGRGLARRSPADCRDTLGGFLCLYRELLRHRRGQAAAHLSSPG